MARSIILSNGNLAVGLNEKGLVHDFYFPYVGLDNLTTARSMHHHVGVWVNGNFSWLSDNNWQVSVMHDENALISYCTYHNPDLKLSLVSKDFVDYEMDAFCRIFEAHNLSDQEREVRIFFHQVFEISNLGRGDTVLYVPHGNYVLDYKGKVSLLISGQITDTNTYFDQHSVGNYRIEGKEGTYKDAEDGELSGNNIEHAGVDSAIRFSLKIPANSSGSVDYWVAAGDSQPACEKIHFIMQNGLSKRLIANQTYWQEWLSQATSHINSLSSEIQRQTKISLMVIKAHCDKGGGIIASCDSSIYNYGRDYYSYVWPRDGAYAMWPLIRLGYSEEPKKFFEFVTNIINLDGYLMHKYQPDQAIGSTWHPLIRNGKTELAIQEDETAIIIVMLSEFLEYSNDQAFVHKIYRDFVCMAASFLVNFIDQQTGLPHASYDLWEEKFETTTYTTAIVYKALQSAADLAKMFGDDELSSAWEKTAQSILDKYSIFINPDTKVFRKGFNLNDDDSLSFDETIDISSFYGVMTFGYYNTENSVDLVNAVKQIEQNLTNPSSLGFPRYENDNYFRKNQESRPNAWIITTLWIAQYYIRVSDLNKAWQYIDWVQKRASESGMLPEQIDPDNENMVSVTPLVWSHAEYINTILDLKNKSSKQ